jgi:hypothetical protein
MGKAFMVCIKSAGPSLSHAHLDAAHETVANLERLERFPADDVVAQ